MRTAEICPTCATFTNALCVVFDGPFLETLNILPMDSVDAALVKIEEFAASLVLADAPTIPTLQQVTTQGAVTTDNISTQGYTSSGTRAGGDLLVTLGDYDLSSTGARLNISLATDEADFTSLSIITRNGITFKGNTFDGILAFPEWTADRTITFPDSSGEVAVTGFNNQFIGINRFLGLSTLFDKLIVQKSAIGEFYTTIFNPSLTADRTIKFADAGGTIPMSVNGNLPNLAGNITIPTNDTTEGVDILSTGETIGKVLQSNGDNSSSWVILPGGGDALVSNPLNQFAPTTLLQLNGVISDATLVDVTDLPITTVDFDPVGTDNSNNNAINLLYEDDYRLSNFVAGTDYQIPLEVYSESGTIVGVDAIAILGDLNSSNVGSGFYYDLNTPDDKAGFAPGININTEITRIEGSQSLALVADIMSTNAGSITVTTLAQQKFTSDTIITLNGIANGVEVAGGILTLKDVPTDTAELNLTTTNFTAVRTQSFQDADGILALTTDVNAKQDTLVSATNIKTVNGNSLLGSGDLVISGGELLLDSSTITVSRAALEADADGLNNSTSATDVTITINSDIDTLPIGSILLYKRSGAGNVIIAKGTTTTLNNEPQQTNALDDTISLRKIGASAWEFLNPPSTGVYDDTAIQAEVDLNTAKPSSDPTGVTGAIAITNMMSLTQIEYDAIVTPNATTFYLITT